jgi:hypothetical protein
MNAARDTGVSPVLAIVNEKRSADAKFIVLLQH